MSNKYIIVDLETSVSEEAFGRCPGISNLPTQIKWTLFKP